MTSGQQAPGRAGHGNETAGRSMGMGPAAGWIRAGLVGMLLAITAGPTPIWARHAELSPADTLYTLESLKKICLIEAEMDVLARHQGVTKHEELQELKLDLRPRHFWQLGYSILEKIGLFRRSRHLGGFSASLVEPNISLDMVLVYEQMERILTEIRILKFRLGLPAEAAPCSAADDAVLMGQKDPTPAILFSYLYLIANQWDNLIGENISPPFVFAQVMRANADVTSILDQLGLFDTTVPPKKQLGVAPVDSLRAASNVIAEIQRLQRGIGLPRTDFSFLQRTDNVLPADVLILVQMVLAELQTVKAALDLTHVYTPPATIYENQTPADVHQLLRWIARRLHLIESL